MGYVFSASTILFHTRIFNRKESMYVSSVGETKYATFQFNYEWPIMNA